jgi:hypothetical protein
MSQPTTGIGSGTALDEFAVQRHAGFTGASEISLLQRITGSGFYIQNTAEVAVVGHLEVTDFG